MTPRKVFQRIAILLSHLSLRFIKYLRHCNNWTSHVIEEITHYNLLQLYKDKWKMVKWQIIHYGVLSILKTFIYFSLNACSLNQFMNKIKTTIWKSFIFVHHKFKRKMDYDDKNGVTTCSSVLNSKFAFLHWKRATKNVCDLLRVIKTMVKRSH